MSSKKSKENPQNRKKKILANDMPDKRLNIQAV